MIAMWPYESNILNCYRQKKSYCPERVKIIVSTEAETLWSAHTRISFLFIWCKASRGNVFSRCLCAYRVHRDIHYPEEDHVHFFASEDQCRLKSFFTVVLLNLVIELTTNFFICSPQCLQQGQKINIKITRDMDRTSRNDRKNHHTFMVRMPFNTTSYSPNDNEVWVFYEWRSIQIEVFFFNLYVIESWHRNDDELHHMFFAVYTREVGKLRLKPIETLKDYQETIEQIIKKNKLTTQRQLHYRKIVGSSCNHWFQKTSCFIRTKPTKIWGAFTNYKDFG